MSVGLVNTRTAWDSLEHLFGRRAATDHYLREASGGGEAQTSVAVTGDVVELSANVPRPLDDGMFREAARAAEKLDGDRPLSGEETRRMREDAAFAAAIAMLSMQSGQAQSTTGGGGGAGAGGGGTADLPSLATRTGGRWPASVSPPTADDLSGMSRRMSQRLLGAGGASDGESLQSRRRAVVNLFRPAEFTAIAAALGNYGEDS